MTDPETGMAALPWFWKNPAVQETTTKQIQETFETAVVWAEKR